MTKLSKKERKYVSSLITRKLTELGVKDQVTMVDTKKQDVRIKLDENGRPVMVEGKPQLELYFKQEAMNTLRRTVRNLRNQGWEVVEAFLAIEVPKKEAISEVE